MPRRYGSAIVDRHVLRNSAWNVHARCMTQITVISYVLCCAMLWRTWVAITACAISVLNSTQRLASGAGAVTAGTAFPESGRMIVRGIGLPHGRILSTAAVRGGFVKARRK